MARITVCYSTHRPETLKLSARIIEEHDLIILEEPPHNDLLQVLSGGKDIDEHLLELDMDYPAFIRGQYLLLRQSYQNKKQILQIEPYLEHLLRIQYFFADGNSPDEIEPQTIDHSVYCAEREATGALIEYYKQIQSNDFDKIVSAMNIFAKKDAARFVLRDTLRARYIIDSLVSGRDTYIEAGSIHLMLFRLLKKCLSPQWKLQMHSIDRETLLILGQDGNIFSPGDQLTLRYIFGSRISSQRQQLYCAQALIYAKIVAKDEMVSTVECLYPHARNEVESISLVKKLSFSACRELYGLLRTVPSKDAFMVTRDYSRSQAGSR